MTRRLVCLFLLLAAPASALGADALTLEARPHDIVRIKGVRDPVQGTIEKLDANMLQFRKLNGEGCTWARSQVVEILRRCTLQQSYQRAARAAGASSGAHLRLHEACLKAGLKKEAFLELKKAVLVDRKYMPAYGKLLQTARAAGNRDLELWALSTATDAGVATAPMLIRMAELYVLLGLTDNAEEPLRNAVRLQPRNTKAQSRLVMLQLMRGELGPAEKHIAAMLKHSPADPNALVALGQLELAKGRLDRAAAAFDKAALKATSPEAAAGLGAIHLQRGRLVEAEKWYAQAHKIRPGFAPAVAGQALVYARKGWLQKAETLLGEVRGSGAKHPAVMTARGYVAELSGKHDEALNIYEAASALDGANVHALTGAGRCHWRSGNRTAAVTRFRQALALQPAFSPALRGLGRIAIIRSPAEAARYHKQLIDSKAATPEDHAAFAGALMRLQRFGEASAELAKAGNTVHARIGLGFLDYAQGKTDEAVAHFEAAVRLGDYRRYAASAIRRIRLAESRVAWSDAFERADGPEVRNGWTETEPPGVSVSIAGNAVLIDGKPGKDDDRMARLARIEDAAFVAVTVEAETGSEARSSVGVFIGKPNEGPAILLYRDAGGNAVVSVPGAGKPKRLGKSIRQGKFSVSIGVIDRRRGRFALRVNGRPVRRFYTVPRLAGAETLDVGLFAEPPSGQGVNCRFHVVRIVRTK